VTPAAALAYRSVDALLTEHAARRGEQVYLETVEPPSRLTFAELDRLCHRVARWLGELGLRAADRVSILGDNSLAFVVLFLGVQRYGATVNPLNVEVNVRNLGGILADVGPRLILWSRSVASEVREAVAAAGAEAVAFGDLLDGGPGDDLGARLRDLPATPGHYPVGGPRDPGVLDYTSGTTSRPKGVLLTHEAFFFGSASPAERFGVTAGERVLDSRSMAWASPQLLSICGPLQTGATLVLARKFSHRHFFDWIRDYRATIAVGVPTVINMLLDRPLDVTADDVPTLKFITSSAAPLDPDRQREFERRYRIPIVQGCGMTEAGWMAGNPPSAPRPGSIGPPMPYIAARFVDETGVPRGPGEEGELVVSGRQMASAYVLERGRLDSIPQDGFRTGDLGYMDRDGYVHLTGRKKDLIIRGGVNIAPMEVSSALLAHPRVAEAATIGVPDPIYGEAIVSFVVPRAGGALDTAALAAHCRTRLSPFKTPQTIIVLEAIPKTDRGKIARDALVGIWQSARGAGSVSAC
jgi:acyl-coenzyme A synthetase/AMP-(fatty) acid ligase